MDGSPPGSSVHGIFQAIVLEWVAIPVFTASTKHLLNSKSVLLLTVLRPVKETDLCPSSHQTVLERALRANERKGKQMATGLA